MNIELPGAPPTFVCTNKEVEEALEKLPPWEHQSSVRDLVLAIWDEIENAKRLTLWNRSRVIRGKCGSLQDLRALMMYSVENPSRKKRTPMDVKAMVKIWVPIIRGLSTAHDKATLDQCEFDMDQHLTPMLTAPVKQIREFYEQLCAALEADKSIPFFVWAWFRSWGEVMLKRAPDGEIVELKGKLAAEVAELVEKQVQPDLRQALIGALQWRGQESLEKIKAAAQQGGKARMVGRESCLFLEVETAPDEVVRVML